MVRSRQGKQSMFASCHMCQHLEASRSIHQRTDSREAPSSPTRSWYRVGSISCHSSLVISSTSASYLHHAQQPLEAMDCRPRWVDSPPSNP